MVEIDFTIEGSFYVNEIDLEDYTDDKGNVDYRDFVSDNVSLYSNGEFMVSEVYDG